MWSALTFKKMITIFLYLGWQNLQPSLRDQYLTEACHCIFQASTINFFDVEVFFLYFFMLLLYQVDVVMTPPRIKQVRTPQTRVIFGENFQVAIGS